ncbi:ABC transporter substrate-binding protein [Roseomonas eburnea]|uniref:ABC transporter substrate-binding protein n=1 Tax=Neoroseomonas eburnea TaxID=1346889 RepID=A0A9X9XAD7_9PROT|nr:ABC transporter substrate-binding protein [Neoroseomonas eburnea]MBR0680673.1 ABC transporter substrate-binding protein [Neoroseomonas eburnea]
MRRTCLALLLAAVVSAPSLAQTLTMGAGAPSTSLDPHFFNAAPNGSVASHLFSRLVERDSRVRPQPGLAESWRAVSDTVWEFKLRPGVKWHDGRDFTAEDVVFTFERAPNVPNSPGGFGGFLRQVARVEVVDPLTLRIHTRAPHPLLPVDLSYIFIISRHAGEGATTEDYNAGRAAIGTGPYRLRAHMPGERVEFERNDAYWGPREPWARATWRVIANDTARTAALLAGDVDLIDQVPSSDIERLRREGRVSLHQIQGLRMIYLQADFSRDGNLPGVTDTAGQPIATNPFRDVRVRRALSIAINRQALTDRVMEGTAAPSGQWLPPGVYSYNPAVAVPAFDAERARRLLAEAGFPQGFRLTLTSPNDRYPNDARTAQAVAQMWTRIGIRTEVQSLPWSAFSARAARQEFGMRLAGWGSSTGEASYAAINIMGTYNREQRRGASNQGRYSNPQFDALVDRATTIIDDAARERVLHEVVKMGMDDLAVIPLFHLINTWATRRGLTYEARMDESTRAMAAREAP